MGSGIGLANAIHSVRTICHIATETTYTLLDVDVFVFMKDKVGRMRLHFTLDVSLF